MKEIKMIVKYYCDCCEKLISDTEGNFIAGSFQRGMNDMSEIGTWCSEECYKEFFKTK